MTEPLPIIPPHRTPAARAQKVIPALIWLLAAICLTGVSSIVMAAWPFTIGEAPWRFRNAAVLLSAGPQIALLMIVVSVAGVYSGQHRAVRAAATVFFALAVIYVLVVPFFALDFLTLRHLQPQNTIGLFTREGLRLGGTTTLLVPFLLWAGNRGWSASKKDPTTARGVSADALVVGRMS